MIWYVITIVCAAIISFCLTMFLKYKSENPISRRDKIKMFATWFAFIEALALGIIHLFVFVILT